MKGFLSFKFSGEDIEQLNLTLTAIRQKLLHIGLSDVFCSLFLEDFFNQKWWTIQERYDYCLDHMNDKNIVVCFIQSYEKSYGMLWERDKAILYNQPILLLIKEWLEEFHPEFVGVAHNMIRFETIGWLLETLDRVDIHSIVSQRE